MSAFLASPFAKLWGHDGVHRLLPRPAGMCEDHSMRKHVPNILTTIRLVLTFVVFFALIGVAFDADGYTEPQYFNAFIAFTFAAVTDFFDGYLARLWKVESDYGAIMDPIADKTLLAAGVIGMAVAHDLTVGIFGGLMLLREFAVSAMREVLAPKGLKLPVTFLAKTKTTLQLVAIAVSILSWTSYGRLFDPQLFSYIALGLLVLATIVTYWTGIEYGFAARKALRAAREV